MPKRAIQRPPFKHVHVVRPQSSPERIVTVNSNCFGATLKGVKRRGAIRQTTLNFGNFKKLGPGVAPVRISVESERRDTARFTLRPRDVDAR